MAVIDEIQSWLRAQLSVGMGLARNPGLVPLEQEYPGRMFSTARQDRAANRVFTPRGGLIGGLLSRSGPRPEMSTPQKGLFNGPNPLALLRK